MASASQRLTPRSASSQKVSGKVVASTKAMSFGSPVTVLAESIWPERNSQIAYSAVTLEAIESVQAMRSKCVRSRTYWLITTKSATKLA